MITHGTRTFGLIWLGQLVSLSGSGMTRFALSVWVYQQTGSATQFALVLTFVTLPLVLLWPLAGLAADRWNKRTALLLSDAGAGLSTLAVLFLLAQDRLEVWHIYAAVAASSAFGALQWPAYTAAIPLLIPKEHLGRANGFVELAGAIARIVSPLLGGALLAVAGLETVVLVDLASFLVALCTLLLVRIPDVPQASRAHPPGPSLLQEVGYGWRFIKTRPSLLALLLFFVATNFTTAMPQVLVQPLVLSFASEAVLGVVLSIGGVGMVVGGLVMSMWGGPHRLIKGVVFPTALQGVALLLTGLRPSALLIAAGAFIYLVGSPVCIGCNQTLWQRKVPPEVLGRVVALRKAVTGISYPAAYVVAGPLAEFVFEPLLVQGGALTATLGPLVGTGAGRGIGLLIMLAGLLTVLLSAAFYLYPRLRHLEDELPDALRPTPRVTRPSPRALPGRTRKRPRSSA